MYFDFGKAFDKVFEGEQSVLPQNLPFGDTDHFKLIIFKKQKTQK